MVIENENTERYCIGDLIVDIPGQLVTRNGREIALPNLSFDLLEALIRHAPNVVTHKQMMSEVWPGLVVSPETVSKRANLLRASLGDDSSEPRYIALVRGRGFRMAQGIEKLPRTRKAPTARYLAVMMGAIVAVLAAAMFLLPAVTPKEKSVAVIPFANLSEEPQTHAFFVDGLHDVLLTHISKISTLRTISRTSVMRYRDTSKSISEIAEELGVTTILEGSVQRVGDRVRINVQLIDAASDKHLWAESYDSRIEDIFAVQDEITGSVVAALQVELLGADSEPLKPVQRTSPEVYLDYLLVRQLLGNPSYLNLSKSAELLEGVIVRDPDYAPAIVALAMTRWTMAVWGAISNQEAYEYLQVLVPKALAVDDTRAEAWVMRNRLKWIEGDRAMADAALERALELEPENPIVLSTAINILTGTRHPEGARDLVDQLLRVDPLNPESLRWAGDFFARVGEWPRARELLERIRALNPDLIHYHWGLSTQGHLKGEIGELRNVIEGAYELDSSDAEGPGYLAQISVDLGDMESASRWSADALELGPNHPVALLSALYLAVVQNDTDQATRIADRLADKTTPGRMGSKGLALGVLANRDVASGRVADGIARYLLTYPDLAINRIPISDPQDSWPDLGGPLYAALDLARLYASAGDTTNSEALLDAVEEELPYWPRVGFWGSGFAEVELYALRGETDEALQALRDAIDDGSWRFWRWRLLHNPNLDSLQGESELQAIVALMKARMARELEKSRDEKNKDTHRLSG